MRPLRRYCSGTPVSICFCCFGYAQQWPPYIFVRAAASALLVHHLFHRRNRLCTVTAAATAVAVAAGLCLATLLSRHLLAVSCAAAVAANASIAPSVEPNVSTHSSSLEIHDTLSLYRLFLPISKSQQPNVYIL